ncbi:MarC family protein [Candidatus Nesciobacter abundans]|uniref:UPF0056 membrane protein n=1 Tax=Candidatus Nesciobacter abundans TaxID=2601668 RepID=A0A5C0UGF1_9PROT|nr:MarC family protein [Candidatus Nesciobacter abundans]QEK39195.1 NAAT family transporter [Candidatus Nesciobacter abundans]
MYSLFKLLADNTLEIFFILNSIMNAFFIVSLTAENSYLERKKIIQKAIIVVTFSIFAFIFIGNFMLESLGVVFYAMQITGGILVCPSAYDMISGKASEDIGTDSSDVSLYPIGVPIIAGPGAFTTSLNLFKEATLFHEKLITIIAIFLGIFLTYLVLVFGAKIGNKIKKMHMRILSVFFGTILMALGVQFFINGARGFANEYINTKPRTLTYKQNNS